MVVAVLFGVLIGKIADTYSAKIVVPACYIIKGFCLYMLNTISNPYDWKFYVFSCLIRAFAAIGSLVGSTYL